MVASLLKHGEKGNSHSGPSAAAFSTHTSESAFAERPIVVFHTDWILATATAGFALPLAKYVLDEKFKLSAEQSDPFRESLGSHCYGKSRDGSEINAEIGCPARIKDPVVIDSSLSMRLAITTDGNCCKKRPHELSPEACEELQNRLVKKAKVQSVPANRPTTRARFRFPGTITPARTSAPLSPRENRTNISSAASPPFSKALNSCKTLNFAGKQSDNHEFGTPGSIISTACKMDHDRPEVCEKLDCNGQGRNCTMGRDVESLSSSPDGSSSQLSSGLPFGPETVPDQEASAVQNIWLTLIQDSTYAKISDTNEPNAIPTIRVSDALNVLKRLNADLPSDDYDDVTFFANGREYSGRKFAVDKDDRRKTM
ncbi:uncharacterized protein FOMMEDRAFT_25593 [Fomitiporia mediterranea MF3/22]|uniref:uncharacterized protein n=1 Tax=Fomitiporia mediterranea (strain MF3/22) TaxID=694068 RepID=UPI00044074AF|nr:uncharacterized protein FOMMEDRAFT_25593 [Fomitiporia mediterranea MF3/22]EJD08570.1 hypothetical protein FOMMEDRAFT_25593 [Fomitiporia mediterranea MF3/22]